MVHDQSSQATRREFLASSGLVAAGCTLPAAGVMQPQDPPAKPQESSVPPKTDDQAGPRITQTTLAEAEKLAAVEFTEQERAVILKGIKDDVARHRSRRSQTLANGLAPVTMFDSRLPDLRFDGEAQPIVRSITDPSPLPTDDCDIAFAPVTALSRWV